MARREEYEDVWIKYEDGWIKTMKDNIERAFYELKLCTPLQDDKEETKISKLTLREEISQPRSETAEGFSSLRPGLGVLHQKCENSRRKSSPTLPHYSCRRWIRRDVRDERTKVLDILCHKDEIVPDLLILDNQIPFFVIDELFKTLLGLDIDKPLHKYALEFFETIHPRSTQGCMDRNSPPEFFHLLHLFHWSRVRQNKYIIPSSSPQQLDIPNAMELRESATMFEKKMSGSSLDIKFRGRRFTPIIRVFDIPELHIRDYSSIIFHNLIAFEMQSSKRGCCTMAFSTLMGNLLQSEEDVKLLQRKGILQVRSHHESKVSQFCGSITLQYFPNPLVTLSVAAAAMIFVLTLLQTIYTMISYYQHP